MNDSRPWWLWPNLLALDAPAVAVTWQVFLADVAGVAVPCAASIVLVLVVWSAYLIDRGLDARRGTDDSDRHRAAGRNPVAWVTAALAALVAASGLALTALSQTYFRTGAAVGAVAIGYFTAVHIARAERTLARGVKEASVGVVFAAGAAIPLIAEGHHPADWLPGVIAFAALCWLNCVLISRWEATPGSGPPGWVPGAAGVIAIAAACGAPVAVAGAVVVSTTALAALHVLRSRISVRAARVLADAVLMSPLLAAVWS